MTEIKHNYFSLLFQSNTGISYMLVVKTDFENGYAKTMQKVTDLRKKLRQQNESLLPCSASPI
jgi:hypothetical protein